MARKALIEKAKKKPKYKSRKQYRCSQCGRGRGVFRYFGMCRQCVLDLAREGLLPGIFKSSK